MSKDIAAWKCNNGHVMGQVARNGRNVRQLLLYRRAVDMGAWKPEEVEVMAVIEGLVIDVSCSICGAARTWVPGEEAIRRLMESYGLELVAEVDLKEK
jgi:hypothetical protein